MNKTFEIKLYNKNLEFKKTLPKDKIITDINFTAQINGWQWQLNISLNLPITDQSVEKSDIIEVFIFWDLTPEWLLIYTWSVQQINRKFESWNDYIDLTCLGIASLLQFVQYNWTKNQNPAQTIKDIIDYFNSKYSWNLIKYDLGFVENYPTDINISFENKTCFEAINEVVKATNYRWYIWRDRQIQFKPKENTTDHYVTSWKDLEKLNIQEDIEKIINKITIAYDWWTTTQQDTTSINLYGLKEKFESKTDLKDLTSANSYALSLIEKNKNPLNKMKLTINDDFKTLNYNYWDDTKIWDDTEIWQDYAGEIWIEFIEPWDILSIRNLNISVNSKQVNKINYSIEKVDIDLEWYNSIGNEIFNN